MAEKKRMSKVSGGGAALAFFLQLGGGNATAHEISPILLDVKEVVGPITSTFEEHCVFPLLETWSPDVAELEIESSYRSEQPEAVLTGAVLPDVLHDVYRHLFGPTVEIARVDNELRHCNVVWKPVQAKAYPRVFNRIKNDLKIDDMSISFLEYDSGRIESIPEAWTGSFYFVLEDTGNFPIEVSVSLIGDRKEGVMTLSARRWPPLGLSLPLN